MLLQGLVIKFTAFSGTLLSFGEMVGELRVPQDLHLSSQEWSWSCWGYARRARQFLQAFKGVRCHLRAEQASPRTECRQRKAQQANSTQTACLANKQTNPANTARASHKSPPVQRVLGPEIWRCGRSTSALPVGNRDCGWTEMGSRWTHGQPCVCMILTGCVRQLGHANILCKTWKS